METARAGALESAPIPRRSSNTHTTTTIALFQSAMRDMRMVRNNSKGGGGIEVGRATREVSILSLEAQYVLCHQVVQEIVRD
jgi:hypothetical protein